MDDDPEALALFLELCRLAGFSAVPASSGREALDRLKACRPDIVLLDAHLPDGDGAILVHELKNAEGLDGIPVVVMSADKTPRLEAASLALRGADDFIAKFPNGVPIAPEVLRARLNRAMLNASLDRQRSAHRAAAGPGPDAAPRILAAGPIELDLETRAVHVKGRRRGKPLCPKPFALLTLLMRRAGRTLSKELIVIAVYGGDASPNAAEQDIGRLRKKLGRRAGRLIRTVPGAGYVLDAAPRPPAGDHGGSP